jgi:hypothetical protein
MAGEVERKGRKRRGDVSPTPLRGCDTITPPSFFVSMLRLILVHHRRICDRGVARFILKGADAP